MSDITLIFPDQLFQNHPALQLDRPVYLAEEFLFFKVQIFHKQRLALLKSAMRRYALLLETMGYEVVYIPSSQLNGRGDLFNIIGRSSITTIHMAEFADEWLHHDLDAGAKKYHWKLSFYPSPGFICSNQELESFFKDKDHFSMARFYAIQRKTRDILMEEGKPVGGKYSFDIENRKKIPKNVAVPEIFKPKSDKITQQAIKEVENEFKNAIGHVDSLIYPSTHEEAQKVFELFLKDKLTVFGDYQDAMQKEDSFLFHSVLSPILNIGLLTPLEVIHKTVEYAYKYDIPLNSLEGFIRQVMGWREFVRASYILKGSTQRSINFFRHNHKIPSSFWNGTTGILPIDTIVKRVLKTGYCNHIERLMVFGNFLLLTETAPNEIYKWFMAYFVDAYDWVMVPNVYGMSQYADGGIIITKPYISSSNYILKMSNYPKGEWCEIWDGLFWRFLEKHLELFSSNQRTLNMVRIFHKNQATISHKIQKAEEWLSIYHSDQSV